MDEQYKEELQDRIEDTRLELEDLQARLLAMQHFAEAKPVWWSKDGRHWSKATPAEGEQLHFCEDYQYSTSPPAPPNLKLELELTPETALVLLAVLNNSEYEVKEQVAKWPEYGSVKVPHMLAWKVLWEPEDSVARKLQKYLDEVVQAKGD